MRIHYNVSIKDIKRYLIIDMTKRAYTYVYVYIHHTYEHINKNVIRNYDFFFCVKYRKAAHTMKTQDSSHHFNNCSR